jgi:hypothetical protein
MADEEPREGATEPAEPEGSGPAESAAPESDETAVLPRDTADAAGIADAAGPADTAADETAVVPRADETAVVPDSAETTVLAKDVGPTGTTVMPKVDAAPRDGAQWSGRAEVRPVERPRDPTPTEQWELGQRPSSGVVIPALITISVAILLALIAVGVFAFLRGESKPTPTQPPTSAAPTSTAPTTAPPTTAPTSGPVPTVTVPVLRGIPEAAAIAELTLRGLNAEVIRQPSTEMPAGYVITSDPNAGTAVEPNSTVKIIVSTGSPTPPTSAPPTGPPTDTATASPPA